MTTYRLELASRTFTLTAAHSERVVLDRLESGLDGRSRLALTVRDQDIVGNVGLFSSVKLSVDGTLVFAGKVVGEEGFSSPEGKGKRIDAGGPMVLAGSVIVCDDAGVPKLSFASTTMGAVLLDLLSRHGDQLRQAGAAGPATFYDGTALGALTDPVDLLWLENRDFASATAEVLAFGSYAPVIDLDTLFWRITALDALNEFSVDLSSGTWALAGYSRRRRLENSYSAVRLVSDRQIDVGYTSATPAWDSGLESTWQIAHAFYADGDDDDPDPATWVYRRFSYAGISGLLEDQPVELVQKIKDIDGNDTYVPVDTLTIDRENRYVIARYPVLAVPGSGRIAARNSLVPGKSQAGQAYVRYRTYGSAPQLSQRYPAEDHAGWTVDSAGTTRELTVYAADDRQVNADRARRLWRQANRADQMIRLTLAGTLPAALFAEPMRVRLRGASDLELNETDALVADRLAYDFGGNRLEMELRYV